MTPTQQVKNQIEKSILPSLREMRPQGKTLAPKLDGKTSGYGEPQLMGAETHKQKSMKTRTEVEKPEL